MRIGLQEVQAQVTAKCRESLRSNSEVVPLATIDSQPAAAPPSTKCPVATSASWGRTMQPSLSRGLANCSSHSNARNPPDVLSRYCSATCWMLKKAGFRTKAHESLERVRGVRSAHNPNQYMFAPPRAMQKKAVVRILFVVLEDGIQTQSRSSNIKARNLANAALDIAAGSNQHIAVPRDDQ